MDLNRNQYFLIGLVVLLVGVEFRMVQEFVLNAQVTATINERFGGNDSGGIAQMGGLFALSTAASTKSFEPPRWLGWALMSIGAVLILHSMALKRPEAA